MLPKVYELLYAQPAISGAVGNRIYRHGYALDSPQRPYITWFLVAGNPEDQLSGVPCTDFDLVQIDAWSDKDSQVEQIAYAVREALDAAGHANRLIMNTFDKDTKLYRIGIEVNFIRPRPA